jgi:nucleotide-binding universal stress UspA family protein
MYARILVPVDGSAASSQGLDEAIELARHLKTRIRLVHVVELWIMATTNTMLGRFHEIDQIIRSDSARLVKESEAKIRKSGVEVDSELIETKQRPAGECILDKAKEVEADLIVCGTHGRRGIRRMSMGSDAEYIVRRAPVPVLLVRHQASAPDEVA